MKKVKLLILAAFALGFIVSCDETLDINTDPLAATSADPNAVLPFVFTQYSARKVTELGTRIPDVSQYYSDTFNSPKNGTTSSFLTGNTWQMMYNQVLGNLSLVKADAAAAGTTSNNVNALATIISGHVFIELTSLWERVPFTEALDGQNFPSPNFDEQETVLRGAVGLFDEAIDLIDAMPSAGNFTINSNSDFFYGGDMQRWRILGNSLKLRALMMLRSGGANVDAEINECLSQPLMTDNIEAAYIPYAGTPGAESGLHTIVTAFFGPSNEEVYLFGPGPGIADLLYGTADPRLNLWIANNNLPAPDLDTFASQGETSVFSNNVIRPSIPDVVMTPAEIDLYKAQLALEGVAAAGSADNNYRAGVTNALRWWGQDIPGAQTILTDDDISSYVNSLSAPALIDVYNQQYLAAFLQPIMAWNHVRRNQAPVLDAPPAANISTILKRFNYPPDEVGSNTNTPENLPTDVPMWFENL